MENDLTFKNINNRVYDAYNIYYSTLNRDNLIKELKKCLNLCDELIEKEHIEYNSLSYVLQCWYFLFHNNDTYELKISIQTCIITEKLKPI